MLPFGRSRSFRKSIEDLTQLRGRCSVFDRGELIQMLDAQKKNILLIAIAVGILVAAILFWLGSGMTLRGTTPQLTPTLVIIGVLVLVVTLCLVVVLFCCSKTSDKQLDTDHPAGAPALDKWQKKILLVLV